MIPLYNHYTNKPFDPSNVYGEGIIPTDDHPLSDATRLLRKRNRYHQRELDQGETPKLGSPGREIGQGEGISPGLGLGGETPKKDGDVDRMFTGTEYLVATAVSTVISSLISGKGTRDAANKQMQISKYNQYATQMANKYNADMEKAKTANIMAQRSRENMMSALSQYAAPGASYTMGQVGRRFPYEDYPESSDYEALSYDEWLKGNR